VNRRTVEMIHMHFTTRSNHPVSVSTGQRMAGWNKLTSTTMSDPVMKVDASDARKMAVLFNSSTFPRRFMGVREHHIFFWASRAGTRFKAVSM